MTIPIYIQMQVYDAVGSCLSELQARAESAVSPAKPTRKKYVSSYVDQALAEGKLPGMIGREDFIDLQVSQMLSSAQNEIQQKLAAAPVGSIAGKMKEAGVAWDKLFREQATRMANQSYDEKYPSSPQEARGKGDWLRRMCAELHGSPAPRRSPAGSPAAPVK
jgi:hypothetical protein